MKTFVKIGIGVGVVAGVGLLIDSICDIIADKVVVKMASAAETRALPNDEQPLEPDEISDSI